MKAGELVELYAEAGYLVDPNLCSFLVQLPDISVKKVLAIISTVCPNTIVIGFETLAKAIGMWVVVDSGRGVMLMIPEERFYFSLSRGAFCGLWGVL
jgi:hypothetical protein